MSRRPIPPLYATQIVPGDGTAEQPDVSARPWFVVPERLESVDSTNRYLVDRARQGAPEGSSVIADRQTAGRGRLARTWTDVPDGSVLCSMLFRPAIEMERWFLVSMIVALAGLDACADGAGVEARCKWPNDLAVGGRKIAGILAQVAIPQARRAKVAPPAQPAKRAQRHSPAPAAEAASTAGSSYDAENGALVVGIGINCNWGMAWESVVPELASTATSLDRVAGRPVDREAVAARLLERVAQRYAALAATATATSGTTARSVTAEYRRKLDTIGRTVRVELCDEVFSGYALDVDDGGRLLVDVGVCIRTVEAGDVVHLR